MENYQVIGKRVPRIDASIKANGSAKFTNDIYLPHMLFGKLLRSPFPHARILNIDTVKARKLPGVKAVITGKDIPVEKYGVFPQSRDQYLLAKDKVRYIGEEIAAVAAVNEEVAEEAIHLIHVEYDPLIPVFDPITALDTEAPIIHEHAPNNISAEVLIEFGDIDKGFSDSEYIVEEKFSTTSLAHCQLEPYTSVASYDPHSKKLSMWMPHQSPFTKQRGLSNTLQMPLSDIRILKCYIGGAFGGRSEVSPADLCAALLSIQTKQPVKICFSREENFTSTRQKHPWVISLKMGATKDGKIKAIKINIIADGGAYNSTGRIAISASYSILEATYNIPHIYYKAVRVYTNNPIRGAMKGHGAQQLFFAVESVMDILAERLHLDPLEIRLKNIIHKNTKLVSGSQVTSCGLEETLLKAAETSQFKEKWNKQIKNKGIGISCCSMINGFNMGFRSGSTAYIKFNEEGGVSLFTGTTDNGQGNDSMMVQIVAEEIGIPMEEVTLISADTTLAPLDPGSYSMSSTFVSANAVKAAAQDARRQIISLAAEELEANELDIELVNKMAYVKGCPTVYLPLSKIIVKAYQKGKPVFGSGHFRPDIEYHRDWTGRGHQMGQVTGAYSYGTAVAEVEIDPETGEVKVLRAVVAQDCGRALNPTAVEGQSEGSVAFGIGQALTEGLVFNNGQVANPNFIDYKIPIALDMPEISSFIVESNDPNGPYGAKEASEAVHPAVIPAIANAITKALGVRLKNLPISSESILKRIHQA